MEDRRYKVYMYTSPDGKVYIGFTGKTLKQRANIGSGYSKAPAFYKAIQEYGWGNFKGEILEDNLTRKEASERERYYIALYKSNEEEFGYNRTAGGIGALGLRYTDEQKARKSVLEKEICNRPDVKKKMSETAKKFWNTEEGKIKKSNATRKNWANPDHRKKMTETRKKMWESEEYKEKRRKSLEKYYQGEEWEIKKQELLQKKKERWADPEYRKAHTGENHPSYGIKQSRELVEQRREKTSKPCLCIETGIIYTSCTEAAHAIGYKHHTHLCAVCRGERPKFGGYHWKYVSKEEYEEYKNRTAVAESINTALDNWGC